jgi:hypothetical protein
MIQIVRLLFSFGGWLIACLRNVVYSPVNNAGKFEHLLHSPTALMIVFFNIFALDMWVMKMITLQFPDTIQMTKFIIDNNITKVQTNSNTCIVTGEISIENINLARNNYQAFVHTHAFFE